MPATPVLWRSAIAETIADVRADFQGFARVAELSDGRFVLAWLDATDQGGDTNRIGFRIFNADGTPATDATFPTQFTTQADIVTVTRLDVAGREDGGFTIVVTEDDNGAVNTDSEAYNFNSNGGFIDSDTVRFNSRDENHNVEVDGFRDGFVAVSDHNDEGVAFVARNGPGTDVQIDIPIAANEDQTEADVAYLGDGRAVIVYTRELNNSFWTTDIAWDIVSTATGGNLQSGAVASSANDRDDVAAVAALESGGFAIVYRDYADGVAPANRDLQLIIYDENGAEVGSQLIESANDATNPRIASQGDEVVVVWEQTTTDTIWLQRFDANTAADIGGQVQVQNGAPDAFNPDIALSTDGRYLISYQLGAGAAGDVYFSIYDPRDNSVVSPGGQATTPSAGGTLIGTGNGEAENFYGTANDDLFIPSNGSVANSVIDGITGEDTVDFSGIINNGIGGNLFGTMQGVGLFNSDAGNYNLLNIENIIATTGNDTISGNDFDNEIWFGGGDDVWFASNGDDIVHGGSGVDRVRFDNAASGVTFQVFNPNAQSYSFPGFPNPDTLQISSVENVTGSAFDDTISGNGVANVLNGGSGDDFLVGGGGDDVLFGNNDDDRLRGGGGNDTLNGSNGFDFADYASSNVAITVDLANLGAQNTGAGVDTLSGIEGVIGGSGNDDLRGDAQANTLVGNDGNDLLIGFDGNDTLRGGAGNDDIRGGNDTDTVSYAGAAGGITVSLANTAFQNTGGAGIDRLLSVENILGSSNNDVLAGSNVANDMQGGFGNDVLNGGLGADTLNGGRGFDELRGGGGADLFVFRQNGAQDTILDFQNNVDTIDLTDFGFANVAQAQGYATQVGADVRYLFSDNNNERLIVENATIAQLNDDLLV